MGPEPSGEGVGSRHLRVIPGLVPPCQTGTHIPAGLLPGGGRHLRGAQGKAILPPGGGESGAKRAQLVAAAGVVAAALTPAALAQAVLGTNGPAGWAGGGHAAVRGGTRRPVPAGPSGGSPPAEGGRKPHQAHTPLGLRIRLSPGSAATVVCGAHCPWSCCLAPPLPLGSSHTSTLVGSPRCCSPVTG